MSAPIFITGLPRSGTSLVAGILALCGAWTGDTTPPSPWNRKGGFENEALKDRFVKPYLAMGGTDPLGLDPLPGLAMAPLVAPDLWRQLVTGALHDLGLPPEQPWLFKDAKLALVWRQWAAAFPDARWLVVRRLRDHTVASALRAEPMARRLGYDWARWKRWAGDYLAHVEALQAGVEDMIEVWPDRDVFHDSDVRNDPDGMKPVVEGLGLTWRPQLVADFIDDRLWHPPSPAASAGGPADQPMQAKRDLSAEAPAGA